MLKFINQYRYDPIVGLTELYGYTRHNQMIARRKKVWPDRDMEVIGGPAHLGPLRSQVTIAEGTNIRDGEDGRGVPTADAPYVL